MEKSRKMVELFGGALALAIDDRGAGRPYLILHGGAGPGSVAGLAAALAGSARAVVPTHPGFQGEPRPDWFCRVADLALAYLALLDALDLRDVVVVGNSIGGWIAAEMALRNPSRLSAIVMLNAVGIETRSGEPAVVDPMKVTPQERAALAFHDPAEFAIAPSSPEAVAAMIANQKTLRVYAGELMYDPTLRERLAQMARPVMFAWGESDRIASAEYGRLFAACIPAARFEPIAEAGHFPHIERRDEVVRLISAFAPGAGAKAA